MSAPEGRIGVLFVNFGEPDDPTHEKVVPFLERIFLLNAGLEPDQSARKRARQLAEDRAPGLIEEYESIGGSPLNGQADARAERVERALAGRGWDVRTYSAFQFTDPSIEREVSRAAGDGVELLVALPVYPLCGQSTTVAGLAAVRAACERADGGPQLVAVSGWHHDSRYEELRADHVGSFVRERGLDLGDPDTLLYFSAHGTPLKYLAEGNRYDRYVEEHCRRVAERLGADRYAVGFQNHTNRRIRWTQPDNEDRIREAVESRLVMVPISFMHEQSETLAELDHELRGYVEGLGKELHRVPVPHDDPRFDAFVVDLVTRVVASADAPEGLSACRCAPQAGTWCTNGTRDLPPSPYAELEETARAP